MISYFNIFLTYLSCLIILVKASSNDPKIVGGLPASEGEFPYQVSVTYDGNHKCGGSIVDERHVITSGQCVVDKDGLLIRLKDLQILGGGIYLNKGKPYLIIAIHLHHGFKVNPVIVNDIAILRIRDRFVNDQNTKSVNLPKYPYKIDDFCTVSGWGTSKSGSNELQKILHSASIRIMIAGICKNWLNSELAKDMLCAGLHGGGTDACEGDSGGPLVCNKTLTGIYSHGYSCGIAKKPGIYTDVHYHIEWITDILKNSSTVPDLFVPLMVIVIIVKLYL